jgi:hypothetical protein
MGSIFDKHTISSENGGFVGNTDFVADADIEKGRPVKIFEEDGLAKIKDVKNYIQGTDYHPELLVANNIADNNSGNGYVNSCYLGALYHVVCYRANGELLIKIGIVDGGTVSYNYDAIKVTESVNAFSYNIGALDDNRIFIAYETGLATADELSGYLYIKIIRVNVFYSVTMGNPFEVFAVNWMYNRWYATMNMFKISENRLLMFYFRKNYTPFISYYAFWVDDLNVGVIGYNQLPDSLGLIAYVDAMHSFRLSDNRGVITTNILPTWTTWTNMVHYFHYSDNGNNSVIVKDKDDICINYGVRLQFPFGCRVTDDKFVVLVGGEGGNQLRGYLFEINSGDTITKHIHYHYFEKTLAGSDRMGCIGYFEEKIIVIYQNSSNDIVAFGIDVYDNNFNTISDEVVLANNRNFSAWSDALSCKDGANISALVIGETDNVHLDSINIQTGETLSVYIPDGIIQETGLMGNSADVALIGLGVDETRENMLAGTEYFLSFTYGEVYDHYVENSIIIGKAISPTQLALNLPYTKTGASVVSKPISNALYSDNFENYVKVYDNQPVEIKSENIINIQGAININFTTIENETKDSVSYELLQKYNMLIYKNIQRDNITLQQHNLNDSNHTQLLYLWFSETEKQNIQVFYGYYLGGISVNTIVSTNQIHAFMQIGAGWVFVW